MVGEFILTKTLLRNNGILLTPISFKWTIAERINLRRFCTPEQIPEGNGPDGLTTPSRRSQGAKVRGRNQPPVVCRPSKIRSRSHFKFVSIASSISDSSRRLNNSARICRGAGPNSKRAIQGLRLMSQCVCGAARSGKQYSVGAESGADFLDDIRERDSSADR